MDSLKDYAEMENMKNMIGEMLSKTFSHVVRPEERKELTELTIAKLYIMNEFKKDISAMYADEIAIMAADSDMSEDELIRNFMYLYLIVENTWLGNKLALALDEDD
jgi:hypothetical protein